jgi:adenine-specific DNA-methyltransferase
MQKEKFDKVLSALGRPAYQAERVAIYNMDCIEAMKKLPDSLVDLTITSPPYNIGKEYEDIVELDRYVEWCRSWIAQIHRITKNDGSFWLNVGYLKVEGKGLAVPISYLLWDKTDFYLLQEIVWNYAAGVACRTRFSPRNEKILWYVKNEGSYTFNLDEVRDPNVKYPNQKKNGKLKCNPLGKNPSDVWQIAKVTSGQNRSSKERTAHPAQFPTEMVDRVIKSASNKGDLIVDPFMGSGSTAISAIENERFVVGFEINKQYIDIISERIERHLIEKEMSNAQDYLFLE